MRPANTLANSTAPTACAGFQASGARDAIL